MWGLKPPPPEKGSCAGDVGGLIMNKHPFLGAVLAGIPLPTVLLLVAMTAYTIIRYVYDVPIAIEKVIVFPMAAVPNAWGLGNGLHLALGRQPGIPLALSGAAHRP